MEGEAVESRLAPGGRTRKHTSALVGVVRGVPGHGLIGKIEVPFGPGRRVVLASILLLGSFAELTIFVFAVQFRHKLVAPVAQPRLLSSFVQLDSNKAPDCCLRDGRVIPKSTCPGRFPYVRMRVGPK